MKQAAPHVRTIKRAQDMLGKLHDLQVLQMNVAAVQAEPRTGRPRTGRSSILRATSKTNAGICTAATSRPPCALRDAVTAVRKVVVPQLAHPPRRSRSIKMALSRPADAACRRRRPLNVATLELYLDSTRRCGRTRRGLSR